MLTLATKLQLQLCYKLLSKKGLESIVEYGKVLDLCDDLSGIPREKNNEAFFVTWVKVNGTFYKPGFAFCIGLDNNEMPCFGVVSHIVVNDINEIFFLYRQCSTLSYNDHIKCFNVCMPSANTSMQCYQRELNKYVRPMKIHCTCDGEHVILRRDMH